MVEHPAPCWIYNNGMSVDERLKALTMTAELLLHESQEHTKRALEHTQQLEMDAEHIRALARIAELHHERLARLES
jgi:hypothetical protein